MAVQRIEKDSMGEIDVPASQLWGLRHSVLWSISVSHRKNAESPDRGIGHYQARRCRRQ